MFLYLSSLTCGMPSARQCGLCAAWVLPCNEVRRLSMWARALCLPGYDVGFLLNLSHMSQHCMSKNVENVGKNARCWLFDCAESFQTTVFQETVVCFMSVGSKRQHFREKQDNPVPFVGFFLSERKNSQPLFMPPCRNVVYFLKTRFFTTSVHNFPGLKGVSTGNAAIFYGFPIFIQHTPGHKG